MRKILFSTAMLLASIAFGQITLEKSFANDNLQVYTNATETFYYTAGQNMSTIKIYNADYTLKKQFTPTIPSGFEMDISQNKNFILSKNIFNNDNLLEIVVNFERWDSTTSSIISIITIYNEDGIIVKDFRQSYRFDDDFDFHVYHDNTANTNKLRLFNESTNSTEIYNLSTTSLATKEIQTKNKLSAFPIPTNKILHIYNPKNNANKVDIFDVTGKLMISKSFNANEDKISVNVENLTKGNYFYNIGDLSSKFIKN